MSTKIPQRFDFEEKLDAAIDRAKKTVEEAKSSMETKSYPPRRAVVVSGDEEYLHEAVKSLTEANVDALAFRPDELAGMEKALALGGTTAFVTSVTADVIAVLQRARPRKLVIAVTEEEQIWHHRELVDLGAMVIRSRPSPDLLRLAV